MPETGIPQLKRHFKSAAPGLYALCSATKRRTRQLLHDYLVKDQKIRFREIYRTCGWGSEGESASGPGSSLAQTALIRNAIPSLIKEYGITSMLDIPCGDFWWARHMELERCRYIGADIVEELVLSNSRNYGGRLREFCVRDLTQDRLPTSDLVLCRDCLIHLSFRDINKALANIKASGSKYLLTTTFTDRPANLNTITGGFRPLNLQIAPFDFPNPICVINEGYELEGGTARDKSLGFWRIDELPA